jgi:hypothetical protein
VPIGHITNGVHVPSGWRRRCSVSTTAIWAPAGTSTAANAHLGRNRERRRRRTVGNASQPEIALLEFVRRRATWNRPSGAANPPETATFGAGAQPRRADHRIRPALRHLQARQPDSGGYRKTGLDGERSQAAGAVRLRRQGPSHDEPGKRVLQQIAELMRDPSSPTSSSSSKTTTSTSAAIGAGRGRVAEQSPAAAGSLRHQRPEGGAERRPESFRAGRLVGGSLRRLERLRHRHRPDPFQHGRPRPRDGEDSIACCAKK